MASRVYYSSTSGGDTNTQSATVQTDHRTLTFTPDASSTYLILGYCETQVDNNAARDTQVRLWDDTASAELEISLVEMLGTGATEWYPVSFAYLATFGGSPPSQTYKIQHKLESTNTNTDSYCRNGSLVAIKLAAADASMSNDGTATSTANPGAWTDYDAAAGTDNLTFTPGSTGDYLILAFARLAYSATTNGAQLRLLCEDGSTAVATTRWVPSDSTSRFTWAAAVKRSSLAASSQTFKLQHARTNSGSGTSTLDFVRMVALRLDGFDAATATEDTTADTTTSASYVDLGDTRTDTLASGIDYLLLASADVESNTTGVDSAVTVTDGTNTYAEPVIRAGVADRGLSFLVPRVVTGAGASVTHKFQGKSNGTATLSLDEHRLFVLQVEAAGTSAPAGNATGTGAASNPSSSVAAGGTGAATGTGSAYDATVSTSGAATNAPAGHASGTGAAAAPTPAVAPSAGAATGTGTAATAATAISGTSGTGTGTGTAGSPSPSLKPNAANAAATGAAYDATVSTTSNVNAPAGNASGTGSAFNASVKISANAVLASATAVAYDPGGSIAPVATAATATATGYAPKTSIAPTAGVGTGTGEAYSGTVPSFDEDPHAATVTIRDRGHTATIAAASTTATVRDRTHTDTVTEQATVTVRDRGHTDTRRENR